ncbi:uncharacterized protein LOC141533718 [Cotesia typhae]
MRLTLNTLPQLAVLAKILCLLMVVMCGAVPAMVRSVSLYSTCSSGNITVIGRNVKASARDQDNAPYQKLTTQSDDFSRKLYIFAEKSQRFICFNKRWKPIALPKKQRDAMCQFYETYNGPYLRYRSAVDPTKYLGFNKYGRPIKGQRARPECYNFMKYNPSFSINDHNDWMTGNTRVREVHKPHPHPHHEHAHKEPLRVKKTKKSPRRQNLNSNFESKQDLDVDPPQRDISRPLDLFEKNPDEFLRPPQFLEPEFSLEKKKLLLERDVITYQRNPELEMARQSRKNHLQEPHRHRHTSRGKGKSGDTRTRRHRLPASKY